MSGGVRILVFGGRHYHDRDVVYAALDFLHARRGIIEIIEGGASGADTLAGEWADARGIKRTTVEADWATHARRAGPLRNIAMAELAPDGAVAFAGGKGTDDMHRTCERYGIRVWRPALHYGDT